MFLTASIELDFLIPYILYLKGDLLERVDIQFSLMPFNGNFRLNKVLFYSKTFVQDIYEK